MTGNGNSLSRYLLIAAAIGVLGLIVTLTLVGHPVGNYIGDLLMVAALVVAYFMGRDARSAGKRPGWMGGLVGLVSAGIMGLGYFFVHYTAADFKTVTAKSPLSPSTMAALANSSAARIGEWFTVAVVVAVLAIIVGSIGGRKKSQDQAV